MSKYDNIPMCDESKENISFTIGDQVFLKRMFDRQDQVIEQYINDTYDKHAKIICGVVKEMLEEQKREIFIALEEIKKDIIEIKEDIREINSDVSKLKVTAAEHEFRLKHIEKQLGI